MAWSNRARFGTHLIRQKMRRYHALRPDNPHGVPTSVMRQLQQQTLAGNREPYDLRLQQLLSLHQLQNGGLC